jgi:hypothetical protein
MTSAPIARVVSLDKLRDSLRFVIECPYECGEQHRHGAGSLLDYSAIVSRMGHRVGACALDPDARELGYVLSDPDDVIPRAIDSFLAADASRRRAALRSRRLSRRRVMYR